MLLFLNAMELWITEIYLSTEGFCNKFETAYNVLNVGETPSPVVLSKPGLGI
uniref:Uncharacterized protein n=1 Tax=Anguilla anguilla TaxID=7936 RepID=A0A0E9PI51_ANGAN